MNFPNPPPNPDSPPRAGIRALRNAISAYFVDNGVNAEVPPVGLRYRNFAAQGIANRVVVIPGEFDGASGAPKPRKYGVISRETDNASSVVNPREIAMWERAVTLSVWGAPVPGTSNDEDNSAEIVEDLLEQVIRAVNTYLPNGAIEWGEVVCNAPPTENAFGSELLVYLVLKGPFFDVTLDVVKPTPKVGRG